MKKLTLVYGLLGAVVLALLLMLSGFDSGWVVAPAGLVFVVCGALLAAISSQSAEKVLGVLAKARRSVSEERILQQRHDSLTIFLQVANLNRRGNQRNAEKLAQTLPEEILRRGVQLVVDRTPDRELLRTLQWRLGNERENDQQEIRVIRALAGYAPAMGMLGTLMGLVQMLFALGDKGINEVGAVMGFAMLTTVYGLVASNLWLKPLVTKMEQRSRSRLAWMYAQLEAVMMFKERSHPLHIREALEIYLEGNRHYPMPNLPTMPRIGGRLWRPKGQSATA